MNREQVLRELKERFGEDIIDLFDKSPRRVYVEIKPDSLTRVAGYVFTGLGARFNTATGIDGRRQIEILYHFLLEELNLLFSFRVRLDREKPQIDSLTPLLEGANWIEREIAEMLGVTFRGHPNPERLLLPEEWPEGVYPLRCDYREWDPDAIRDRGV